MSLQKRINWQEEADRATRMADAQLWGAILDCQKTLPAADALDLAEGKDDGGYYRDCISVYRAEQKRRQDS
jgi:hypothetical protein